MVCKEDVFSWFKDLESFKRIDVMYELLNMCIPFEVRFLGSCIEEIGKHTFQELRGPTIIANDADRLLKDPNLHIGLLNETTRHRTVIYMSVLSARNYTCANWFYKTLFRSEGVENYVDYPVIDDNTLSELLLLFTLGLYHPAFTFEQKLYFGKLLKKLIAQSEAIKFSAQHYLPGSLSTSRNLRNLTMDSDTITAKSTALVPGGDSLLIQNAPGISNAQFSVPHSNSITSIVSRTGFLTTVVGAPEMHPFPPQPKSPVVSQATSPPRSRANSPHRIYNIRPLSTTALSIQPQRIPSIHSVKLSSKTTMLPMHIEHTCSPPLLTTLVAFKPLQELISTNNSLDHKNIINNIETQSESANQVNEINNCSKLQKSRSEDENVHLPSNNSSTEEHSAVIFQDVTECNNSDSVTETNAMLQSTDENLTPSCRNYSSSNNTPPKNNVFQYSSSLRNLNCYNCGGIGHSGIDCNGYRVEEITQKPYMLEYDSPSLSDNSLEK